MKDLLLDLKNLFADEGITDVRINPFAGSVLNKLNVINTTGTYIGIFTDQIAVLTAAYNPFNTVMLKLPIDLTLGKGSVEVRGTVVSDFQRFASNYRGIVKDKYFLTQHNIYIQFYPNELTDINSMNKSNALTIINRYSAAVHTHVADFTTDFDTKAAAFIPRYNNATGDQDSATGSIGSDRSSRDTGRDDLDEALFEVYNFSKYIFKADYNKMHNVFPLETLLRHPRHEINHYNGTVDALATVNVSQAIYDDTYIALVRNLSTSDIMAGLEATATTPVGTTTGVKIKGMKSKSFEIINTGSPTDYFLNITNLNLTDAGVWEVDIFKES